METSFESDVAALIPRILAELDGKRYAAADNFAKAVGVEEWHPIFCETLMQLGLDRKIGHGDLAVVDENDVMTGDSITVWRSHPNPS